MAPGKARTRQNYGGFDSDPGLRQSGTTAGDMKAADLQPTPFEAETAEWGERSETHYCVTTLRLADGVRACAPPVP